MAIRHPFRRGKAFPTLWLMTDERMGERVWDAIVRLPRGSGIVFRHFTTAPLDRAAILSRIERIARRRGLVLVQPEKRNSFALYPAHSVREAIAAQRAGAKLIFVSPIYPTRTHPGAPALGPLRSALIARSVRVPAIALGGMAHARFKRMKALGFVGWAAIDGLTLDQKRNAVPI